MGFFRWVAYFNIFPCRSNADTIKLVLSIQAFLIQKWKHKRLKNDVFYFVEVCILGIVLGIQTDFLPCYNCVLKCHNQLRLTVEFWFSYSDRCPLPHININDTPYSQKFYFDQI